MLSIIDIIEDTTVDGPGFRTAIYAAGCPNQCPGCHNPESWDINKGRPVPTEEILEKVLADDFADVTFSGGDPMFQPEDFTKLARAIKEKSRKNIWYSKSFRNLKEQKESLYHSNCSEIYSKNNKDHRCKICPYSEKRSKDNPETGTYTVHIR